MDRREFHRSLLATFGALTLAPGVGFGLRRPPIRVDGARLNRHLTELAGFGSNPEGGVSRLAFSEPDLRGREYAMRLMRSARLEPTVDFAGNIIGRRAGSGANLPPLMFGSHIDSVPSGGNYDGQVGSMSAIEVAHTLADNDITTRHPLEVVIFANEEGGKTGSRALSGEVVAKELGLVTASGYTIGEGIRRIGGNPDRLDEAQREPGSIAAYLELHIEQGDVLNSGGIDIGVVEGIVGIKRWTVTVTGFANHAGTTPMGQRRDALVAGARFIDAVNRVARDTPGRQVGTVGMIEAHPGAPNVIPGNVELSLEIRDLDMAKIDRLFESMRADAVGIGEATGTEFAFENFYVSRAAPTDERLRRRIEDAAEELGLSALRMPSGAGHDAQSIALLAPVGMIFVPSVDGISHSPREFTRPEDVVNGANALLHVVLAVDGTSIQIGRAHV